MPQGVRRSVESLRNEGLSEIQKGTLHPTNLALARGIELGWNGAVSVPELRHVGKRAELIAVTETGHAYEEGTRQVVERLHVRAPLTGRRCSDGPGSIHRTASSRSALTRLTASPYSRWGSCRSLAGPLSPWRGLVVAQDSAS